MRTKSLHRRSYKIQGNQQPKCGDRKLAKMVRARHGSTERYLLTTRHGRGTSTSQVFRRLHVCLPADTVTDWRQELLCSQTTAMEQPTDTDPEERHYVRTL